MNTTRNASSVASMLLLSSLGATTALAVGTDGSIIGDGYGSPLAVQTVQTSFGDDTANSDVFSPNKGSELDAAYGRVAGGSLHLTLTGNLEDNFNKLVLFIDSIPGGINSVVGANLPVVDPSPFPSDPGLLQKMNGAQFEAGFEADYVLVLRHGFTGTENRFDVDFAVLNMGLAGPSNQYLGVFLPTFSVDWTGAGATGTGAANSQPIQVALDNSNILGVVAGDQAADQTAAAAVTTGIEIGLPLDNIGNPSDAVKVTAYINGSNQDFWSNQFLGGLPAPFGGLFSTPPNLPAYDGDQFFVVPIPEPSAFALAGVMLLALCVGRVHQSEYAFYSSVHCEEDFVPATPKCASNDG